MEWSKIPGFLWLLNVLKRVEADYSQPCLGLLAVFSGWCFTVSLRWWSNSQNHRWLRLAETVGVHLVHTSAQVGPPKACCPCPDGFWISLQMQTLQPPKQPVLLLSHSHSGKKKEFPDIHIEIPMFPFVPLPLDLPAVEGLGRTRQKLLFYSVSPSAFMCTLVCKLRAWWFTLFMISHVSFPEISWTLQ